MLKGKVEKDDSPSGEPDRPQAKPPSTRDNAPPPTRKSPPPKSPPSSTKQVQPPGHQREPESPEYGLFGPGQPDPIFLFADGTSKGIAECFEEDVKPENILTGAVIGRLKKFQRIGQAVSTIGKANNLASIYDQLRQFDPTMNDYQLGRYLARLLCEGRDLPDIGGGTRRNPNGSDSGTPGKSAGVEDVHKKRPDDEGPETGDNGNNRLWKPKTHFPPARPPLDRGMPLEDHKQLMKLAVEEKKIIIVRDSSPAAMRWVGRPRHIPKPQDVKAKTIPYDPGKTWQENQFAGLASAKGLSDADRRELLKKRYTIRGEHEIIVDPKGNRLYSDTDLHGVYDMNGQDAWSDGMKQRMNDAFLENMVQHGPHDNWPIRNDKELAGSNAGPQIGQKDGRPHTVTAYLPDGTTQRMETLPN